MPRDSIVKWLRRVSTTTHGRSSRLYCVAVLIPFWLAVTLCVLITALCFGGLLHTLGEFMTRRNKSGSKAPFGVAAGMSFGVVVLSRLLTPTIYVVDGESDCSSYALLGDLSYSYKDGTRRDVPVPAGGYAVINNTTKSVVVREVAYATAEIASFGSGGTANAKPIAPMSHAIVGHEITYFFAKDAPPSSMDSKEKAETHYWLTYP